MLHRTHSAVAALALSLLALTGAAPATAATAAPVTKTRVADPAGDLDIGDRNPASKHLPGTDIRAVNLRFLPRQKALRVTVRFADLKPVRTQQGPWHKQMVYLWFNGVSDYMAGAVLTRSPWASGNSFNQIIGDNPDLVCKGMTYRIDIKKDVVAMTVPARCVGTTADSKARKTRVEVGSVLYESYEDGDAYLASDGTRNSRWVRLR